MARRIVIHLGPEKTGSSALQRHLLANRQTLLERHRVLYPDTGRSPDHPAEAHMRIFRGLVSGAFREVVRDVVLEANETEADLVVLSHERFGHLYRHRPESLRGLGEALQEWDVLLVLYPRRQDDWVMSDYNQRLKPAVFLARIGHDQDIEQTALADAYWRADYAGMLHEWTEAFPDAQVAVRPFERAQLHDEDVVADFGQVIGIDLRAFPPASAGRFNTSLHDLAVSFAVRSNAVMRRWYPRTLWDAWGDVLRAYNKYLRHEFADALAVGTERKFGPLLSPARRRSVLSYFTDGNSLVARRYLPGRSGRLFDEDPPSSGGSWTPPAQIEARHVDLLGPVVGLGDSVPGKGVPAKVEQVLRAFVATHGGRPAGVTRLRARFAALGFGR